MTRVDATPIRAAVAAAVLILSLGLVSRGEAATGTRSSAFEYDVTTGLMTAEIVEPDDAQLCVRTQYAYDGYGNKISATTSNCAGASGAAVFAQRTATSSFDHQTALVSLPGGILASSPDGAFSTRTTNPLSQSEQKVYDPRFGSVVNLTGPNGLATTWQLDADGRKLVETRADHTMTRSESCLLPGRGVENLSSNPDACAPAVPTEAPADAVMYVQTTPLGSDGTPNGPFARTYQDRLGREIRSVTQSFDGNGQASRLVVKDTYRNDFGAVAMTTQPYFFDSGSSLVASTGDGHGRSMTTYDVLGRPIETRTSDGASHSGPATFPDGSMATAVSRTTVAYKGYAVQVTDDLGRSQIVEKNALGQAVRSTDAAGAQLASLYDAFGSLVKTVDAAQNVVTIVYDARGRKVQMTDPDTGTSRYTYDAIGQLVAQQSQNQFNAGQATSMAYDPLGRLISRTEPEFVSTWTYDRYADGSTCDKGVGKLCEVNTDHGVRRRMTYDSAGRVTSNQLLVNSIVSLSTSISYDANSGRVSTQTYPTNLAVAYSYSNLGYPTQLRNAATGEVLWLAETMNAWGAFETQTSGNHLIQTKKSFDSQTGRLTDINAGPDGGTNTPTNSTVLSHHYVYDSVSNLTARNDGNGDGSSGAVTETFLYDQVNRLAQYQVASPAIPNANRIVNLQYDAIGNIAVKSDVGAYTYGARPHAVASVAGTTYAYDANGNMVTASGGKFRGVTYTSFNLPDGQTGAVGPVNSPRYTWQYDADHWRIREDHTDSTGTRTTWYMHPDSSGGMGFEYEQAAGGALTNRHYLTIGGATVGVLVTNGAYTSSTARTVVKTEYWYTDHLGSIAATTDGAGNITNRYAYDPFGKRRVPNGSYDSSGSIVADYPNATDRGFTGHEHLDDIGIIHMNGRLYDPNIGRFLQADPLIQAQGNLQSYNRYAYVMNNPLGATDPSGYFSLRGLLTGLNIFGVLGGHLPILTPSQVNQLIGPRRINDFAHSMPGQAQIDHFLLSHQWALTAVEVVAAAATSYYCGGCGYYLVLSEIGYSSYYAYEGSGRSVSAGFRAALITGATAAINYEIGDIFKVNTTEGLFANAAAHAAAGCALAAASQGNCAAGAFAGGASALAAPFITQYGPEFGVVASSLIGGTASALGGGKFASGAITGAFGYLFNCYLHECFKQGIDAEATFKAYLISSGTAAQQGLEFNKYFDSKDNFFFGRPDIFSEQLNMVWDVKPNSNYGWNSGADQISRYTITGYTPGTASPLFGGQDAIILPGALNRYEYSYGGNGLIIYRPLDETPLEKTVQAWKNAFRDQANRTLAGPFPQKRSNDNGFPFP